MKRRISDLLDQINAADVEIEYNAPLSPRRIEELTMSKIKEKTAPGKRRTIFRVMIAAAIIVTLAVSALAAGSGAAWFQLFFADENGTELSDEQIKLIEQNAVLIDQTQTVDGYTVNVESVINDKQIVYVKLNLFAPEGVALPYGDTRCFENVALYTRDGVRVDDGMGLSGLHDEDKTDNYVEILVTFEIKENIDTSFLLTGSGVTLELTNLYKTYGTYFTRKTEMMAEGTWRFDLQFATTEEDLWERELIGEPVSCVMVKLHTEEETQISLTSVCLRALTIDVVYDYPGGTELESLKWWGTKLVKKDGTEVNVMPSDGSIQPDGAQITGYISFEVDAPIVLDEIAYLEFPGGVKIYADQ